MNLKFRQTVQDHKNEKGETVLSKNAWKWLSKRLCVSIEEYCDSVFVLTSSIEGTIEEESNSEVFGSLEEAKKGIKTSIRNLIRNIGKNQILKIQPAAGKINP